MSDEETQTEEAPKPPLWQRLIALPEGKVLIAGVLMLAGYLTCVGLLRLRSPELSHKLLTMTTTHVFFGRAAGMSSGYVQELPYWLVIVANMAIESYLVLLFFPLFVFSYRRLIVIKPLEDALERARRAARAHERTVMKFGVPGLLLFVWFPFWMTGPLVGSVIGFLIGLRPLVNLAVVLSGTYLAIFCWGLILQRVHERLEALGPYVPFAFVGFIVLVAVSIHIRYAFSKHAVEPEGEAERDRRA